MAAPVLVIDFGSQVTQLIARRVREAGVYCEIVPYNKAEEALKGESPRAIILSGGPASVTKSDTPRAPQKVFEMGVPVLGICYGEMTMSAQLGGRVEAGHNREFGRADIHIRKQSPLLAGLGDPDGNEPVWMSHGDKITAIPPGFEVIATSESSPYAAIADEAKHFYGVQFHPEVAHTPRGATILKNFVTGIAGIQPEWNMHAFRAREIERIRAQVGKGKVICGLSGGVDSSVAAVLIHEAIGDQLTCIFVDTGLMRAGEADEVVSLFKGYYNIPLIHAGASDLFLGRLEGVTDPEMKRKIIGSTFIDVFDGEAHKIGGWSSRCANSSRTRFARWAANWAFPKLSWAAIRSPVPALLFAYPARSRGGNSKSCVKPTRSIWTRSAKPVSTTRSGRRLPFCCRCEPWA
jgi:GMP synthase (glutamine-hydrolysing)